MNNKKLLLTIIIVVLLIAVLLYFILHKKYETLICTGSEYTHTVKYQFDYINGSFEKGTIELSTDDTEEDWCDLIKALYVEKYNILTCNVDSNEKINVYTEVESKHKDNIKDDKETFEREHMNCVIKESTK